MTAELPDRLAPRFFWIKRLSIGYAVFFLFLIGLRVHVAHITATRLAGFEAAARASGRSWTIADTIAHIPPGRPNAVDLYNQAFLLMKPGFDSPMNSNFDFSSAPERYSDLWNWLALGSSLQNKQILSLAHQAAQIPDCDWSPHADQPQLFSGTATYSLPRNLAGTLVDQAMFQHLHGDDVASLQTLQDAFALSAATGKTKNLVAQLVSAAITGIAAERLENISSDLKVDSPAVADAARLMVANVTEHEHMVTRHAIDGLSGESAIALQSVDALRGYSWFTVPVFDVAKTDVCRMTDANLATFSEAQEISHRGIDALYLNLRGSHGRNCAALFPTAPPEATIFTAAMVPYSRALEAFRRVVMELRLARVMLAMRLYHNQRGEWPANSDALVPAYLPAIPRSPDSPNKFKVEFCLLKNGRPDGADRPMVYVDLYTSVNPPKVSAPATGWQSLDADRVQSWKQIRFDENGRQWRDVESWPLSAYPLESRTISVASDDEHSPGDWMDWKNPGNPAALQQPPVYPQKAKRPRNGQ